MSQAYATTTVIEPVSESGDLQGSKDLVAAVQTCHASPERAKPASTHQVKPWLDTSGGSSLARGRRLSELRAYHRRFSHRSSSEMGSEMVQ
jgi:hypothetical protein